MGSKALSQALVTISGASFAPSSSKKSGLLNAHLSSLKSNPTISLSRGFRSVIVPVAASRHKRSLIVRAESNSDANPEDVEAPEEEPEAEIEAEAEKPVVATERKPIVKLGDIMGILNKRAVEAAEKERPTPDIRTGDVVEIKLEVPETRRRVSVYKGIVMSKQNAGIHTTIRIRRIIAGIGVEIVFPVYSPNIKEIKVVSHRKVRRARLYYLRDKLPKFSTFK